MREDELVELVDANGIGVGTATVVAAHASPGLLHRAFSIVVMDEQGHHLLQRRASSKTRFPGLWSNACCGHPAPGSDLLLAARRRARQELGVDTTAIRLAGTFIYRATEPWTEQSEWEYDHVLIAQIGGEPDPDPAEVGQWRWVDAVELTSLVTARLATPWLPGVLGQADASVLGCRP